MIIPVILSGGSGTRLWPLSRELYPKQLLPLVGENSMLQETLVRLSGIDQVAQPIVVCNEHHRFLVAEQLLEAGYPDSSIMLEPMPKNTAPAVAAAALRSLELGDNPVLLVLPADHLIQDVEHFQQAVVAARMLALEHKLVTFGITPTGPETGYGYIRSGAQLDGDFGISAYTVDRFVEKPDRETARAYLDSGEYAWNSGMFVFTARDYLRELERTSPAMVAATSTALGSAKRGFDFIRLDAVAFGEVESDSVDYAVMEKTQDAAVIPMDPGWSDVGSWSSLWEVSEKDVEGNVVVGDILRHTTRDSYLYSSGRLVATVGISGCVVVETRDAVLVADKEAVQDVKHLVASLKQKDRTEALLHHVVMRPWGSYELMDDGGHFLVKRIIVRPGRALSLQSHQHRAEHWVVVKGVATVQVDDRVFELAENESTYIPAQARHRLENRDDQPLEIIEVQTGEILSEEDIVRYDDRYGRELDR